MYNDIFYSIFSFIFSCFIYLINFETGKVFFLILVVEIKTIYRNHP